MRTGIYNISCDYIIGCNYSGCSYELSSTNSNINGSIIGKNYEVVNIDVNTQYNLTVTDINGDDVISIQQLYVHFISLCLPATGQKYKIKKLLYLILIWLMFFCVVAETVTVSLATIDYNSVLITSVTVGVLVPVLIIIAILVAFVIVILLIRNGKIQWYGKDYYMNDCRC